VLNAEPVCDRRDLVVAGAAHDLYAEPVVGLVSRACCIVQIERSYIENKELDRVFARRRRVREDSQYRLVNFAVTCEMLFVCRIRDASPHCA